MILITGCKGQLGSELSCMFPEAFLTDNDELDITDEIAVRKFVEENSINSIINCAAYTAVDKAEDEPEQCTKINVNGPCNLAKTGAKIIHISTDYVFDGTACRPYGEDASINPLGVYARTKAEGERMVFKYAKTATVIRTSWLYSQYGSNFVKTILRLSAERKELKVVFDQIGTPTYAYDLATAVFTAFKNIQPGRQCLYHYSNEGVASWYDFACAIIELKNLHCSIYPIKSDQYPTKAIRPYYSVFDKTKIKNELGIAIPYWRDSLEVCLKKI